VDRRIHLRDGEIVEDLRLVTGKGGMGKSAIAYEEIVRFEGKSSAKKLPAGPPKDKPAPKKRKK